jgi:predicted RNA binding protein YcfA (HicA-like mRNA interferase family)
MKFWPAHENPARLERGAIGQSLCRDWGYRVIHQEGSHIILQTDAPSPQRLSVPNHNPLRVGTLNGIVRAVSIHKSAERQRLLDMLR